MKALLARMLGREASVPESLSYEESRELARHPDAAVRRGLAARTDIRPEILYFLAEDTAAEVRRQIATNDAAPAHANILLAGDRDENVRCDLAQKIGTLLPELSEDERDRIRKLTLDALEVLARDQVTRVRQVLAETLKDSPHVPRDVVRRLARDVELVVCSPILEFSPLLTDADLLELIHSPAVAGATSAISRRRSVSEEVSGAIAETNDVDAVTALLANPSAQIREETLDRLVEGARRRTSWQMPLVERPSLPAGAVRKLAGFVAESVLSVLARRNDLDGETADRVREAVKAGIGRSVPEHESGAGGRKDAAGDADPAANAGGGGRRRREGADPARMAQYVHRLYAGGQLTEERIGKELTTGNRDFVSHALALKAGLPPTVVTRIAAAGSAKAMTALSWKAGLGMRFAIQLQARFAGVPSREILQARDGIDYPLSEEDMKWQLDFFAG